MENKHQACWTVRKRYVSMLHWWLARKIQRCKWKALKHPKVFEWVFIEEKRKIRQILLPFERWLAWNFVSNKGTDSSATSLEESLWEHQRYWVWLQKTHYCHVFCGKGESRLCGLCKPQWEKCWGLDEWSLRNDETFSESLTVEVSCSLSKHKENPMDMQPSGSMRLERFTGLVDDFMWVGHSEQQS